MPCLGGSELPFPAKVRPTCTKKMTQFYRLRSYHAGNTTSRSDQSVKQHRAISSTVVGDQTETNGVVVFFSFFSCPAGFVADAAVAIVRPVSCVCSTTLVEAVSE